MAKQIEFIRRDKQYLRVYDTLAEKLTANEAILLSYLIKVEQGANDYNAKTHFFRCSNKFIRGKLNSDYWTNHRIKTTLESLADKGLIEINLPYVHDDTTVSQERYVKLIRYKINELLGDSDLIETGIERRGRILHITAEESKRRKEARRKSEQEMVRYYQSLVFANHMKQDAVDGIPF